MCLSVWIWNPFTLMILCYTFYNSIAPLSPCFWIPLLVLINVVVYKCIAIFFGNSTYIRRVAWKQLQVCRSVDVSVKLEYGNFILISTLTDKIKYLKIQENITIIIFKILSRALQRTLLVGHMAGQLKTCMSQLSYGLHT